jgi:hypothetical protein|tara:strand:+ start:558 stop:878 length:321 start_codon:yes stop_codon:yes gene_type:complete
MALYTKKLISTDRFEMDQFTTEISMTLYDNTHSVIVFNEGTEKIRVLFGTQAFAASNFKLLNADSLVAIEVGICEVNPSQRSIKVRLDDTNNSAYVRIHQLVSSKR